jgi:septal ring factor EnvC (AmiA/AmiB activator)
MRLYLSLSVLFVALMSLCSLGSDAQQATANDSAALEKRVADRERQLAALQKELQDVRRELQAHAKLPVSAMTPEDAVKSFSGG